MNPPDPSAQMSGPNLAPAYSPPSRSRAREFVGTVVRLHSLQPAEALNLQGITR